MNNLIPEEFQKIIRSYTLFDDVYMNIFFKDEPEIIQFVLRLILDKPDLIVESVHIQDVMTDLVAKTSRLDILAKDKQDKQYNIEFQVELNPNLVKRGRYYLSQLDMQCIHRGEDYDQLPDTYVIFICRGDVIKEKNQSIVSR